MSADTDFATLLALRAASKPSLILFRGEGSRTPTALATLILENAAQLRDALVAGSIVTFEPSRIYAFAACQSPRLGPANNRSHWLSSRATLSVARQALGRLVACAASDPWSCVVSFQALNRAERTRQVIRWGFAPRLSRTAHDEGLVP